MSAPPFQINVAAIPKRLAVTQTMVEDFMIDPIMGCKVIMGINFDVFQRCRVRILWWVPNVWDSSGFGTGKSFCVWATQQLRAILIPGQKIMAYHQSFGAGKAIYWPNYDTIHHPIFDAQKGNVDHEGAKDGKDNQAMPECWHQHYRNGSQVMMPAPGWVKKAIGEAGKTIHRAYIDEVTKIDNIGKHDARGGFVEEAGGIDSQVLGRLRAPSFNQYHPLWGNGVIFSATAESPNHPSWRRYSIFLKEVEAGNPEYAVFTSCYKDFSTLPSEKEGPNDLRPFKDVVPNWATINRLKKTLTPTHKRREVYGIWSRDTKGWYSEEAIQRCVNLGIKLGLKPESARDKSMRTAPNSGGTPGQRLTPVPLWLPVKPDEVFYFMGVDPAPALGRKSDDGALSVLKAWPRQSGKLTMDLSDWWLAFVWAYRLRGADVRQWSGFIHQKHEHFGFSGILLDAGAGGGGTFIMQELAKDRQMILGAEKMCRPICTMEDATAPHGEFILNMFSRRDAGIQSLWSTNLRGESNLPDNMHVSAQQAIEHTLVAWPRPFNERPREETQEWIEEEQWASKMLDQQTTQLTNINVVTRPDGTWQTDLYNARSFQAVGKKDVAYAGLMAYTRFLIWLRMGSAQYLSDGAGGSAMIWSGSGK